MPSKITNAEARQIAEATLARSNALLASTEKLLASHTRLRAGLPFGPDEDALAWARKNVGNNPRLMEAYLKFDQWKKNRPKLSLETAAETEAGPTKSARGNWQAV